MKRIAIVLLAAALCASCRSPRANAIPNAGEPPGVVGQYQFRTADLRLDLDIWADGTYHASMDAWAHRTEEHGHWHMDGDVIVLRSRSGGLQLPIRRLGPVRQAPAGTLQIVEPDSQIGRAIVFSKRRPRTCNPSIEATAAGPSAFYHLRRFVAPWLIRGGVPGGCASVPCSA